MGVIFSRPTALPIVEFGGKDRGYETMRVTQQFHSTHPALDIGNARAGDALTAVADGVVYGVGYLRYPWSTPDSRYGTGNTGGLMVVIRHSSRIFSVYAHLESESVSLGQRVPTGAVIGKVGDSGSAKVGGAHVHFAIVVASDSQLRSLELARRTIPFDLCRDPWPLINDTGHLLTDSGSMIRIEDSQPMRLPGDWKKIYNRRTRIMQGTNLRSEPSDNPKPDDPTVLHTTEFDKRQVFYPRGETNTAFGKWYGGEYYFSGAWRWVYVAASLCDDLETVEPGEDVSEYVQRLKQIAEIASGK